MSRWPKEMDSRSPSEREELEPPKLFAWLGSLATVSLIIVTQFLPRGDNPFLRGAGVIALMLAGVFILIPFFLLKKHGRLQVNGRAKDSGTYMDTTVLVEKGLYAITRHPQYLGYMFLASGFALLSQHWAAFLLAAIGVTLFHLQAAEEERYCLARLGEPYERYLRRVPRFNVILGVFRVLR